MLTRPYAIYDLIIDVGDDFFVTYLLTLIFPLKIDGLKKKNTHCSTIEASEEEMYKNTPKLSLPLGLIF